MSGPSDSSRHFPSFRCKFFRAFCPSFFFFSCVSAPFVTHRHNFSFIAPIVPCILHRQFCRGSYSRSVSNRPCLSTRILLSTFPRLSSLLTVPPPPPPVVYRVVLAALFFRVSVNRTGRARVPCAWACISRISVARYAPSGNRVVRRRSRSRSCGTPMTRTSGHENAILIFSERRLPPRIIIYALGTIGYSYALRTFHALSCTEALSNERRPASGADYATST